MSTRDMGIRTTIHAGEPGASIPAVRSRIEDAWGARAFDHAGATEVGAYGFSCPAREGLHVNEAEARRDQEACERRVEQARAAEAGRAPRGGTLQP